MAKMRLSEEHQRAADELLADEERDGANLLHEASDSSCLCGYDGDGSTCYEVFSNGFRLAAQAAEGDDVWEVRDNGGAPPTAYFFLGTEEEVLAKLRGLLG